MPRIYLSNNDPVDFCRSCFHNEAQMQAYAEDYLGETGQIDYDCDHPPYDDTDYECTECGTELISIDDTP